MLEIYKKIQKVVATGIQDHYDKAVDVDGVMINDTRPDFPGEFTVVLFPYLKLLGERPDMLGKNLGEYLQSNLAEVKSFNIVKGFLNLEMTDQFWSDVLSFLLTSDGAVQKNGKKVMVEFSSPNTNKPLHMGHLRNIFLGWSCAQILEADGYEVIKTQIINDRGIAICKSMVAWSKYGNGETPETLGIKGDLFVGNYYVKFDKKIKEEYAEWQHSDAGLSSFENHKKENEEPDAFYKRYKNDYFNNESKLGNEAKAMLLKWEAGDEETLSLWKKMNGWVYGGFDDTYEKLGVTFDILYYESQTYLLGKENIYQGLEKGLFYKKEDGSIWVDLEDEGYDQKILLRSDGTSVYMTQDVGTAIQRHKDYGIDKMVYTVGDEQDYHFQVLFEILKKMGEPYAEDLHHLSYGMVELPTGRMKSREGTVVDADDLYEEVISEARGSTEERGGVPGVDIEEQNDILKKIGLGALKFFILKVTAKKKMIFNPAESVDMQGQTGPYIQNAYVRIQSILRKVEGEMPTQVPDYALDEIEKKLIKDAASLPSVIHEAAEKYDPSTIANYVYNLAKTFHRYYHDFRILGAENEADKNFRLLLIKKVGDVLKTGMTLLGIEMPERM